MKKLKAKLTDLEIEALLCGVAEWQVQNKSAKDPESKAIRKALKKAEKKLIRLLRGGK